MRVITWNCFCLVVSFLVTNHNPVLQKRNQDTSCNNDVIHLYAMTLSLLYLLAWDTSPLDTLWTNSVQLEKAVALGRAEGSSLPRLLYVMKMLYWTSLQHASINYHDLYLIVECAIRVWLKYYIHNLKDKRVMKQLACPYWITPVT